MKIVVFGADSCKYCNYQKGYIKQAFKEDDWLYIDLNADKEAFDLVKDLDLGECSIPTVILLNSKFQVILKKEGTMPSDQIFKNLVGGISCIPCSENKIQKINKGGKFATFLTYEPKIATSQTVDIANYDNKKICSAKILDSRRVTIEEMERDFGKTEVEEYLALGGRKDWAWLIEAVPSQYKGK